MIGELKGQVTEACLTELMDQLVQDTNFYVQAAPPTGLAHSHGDREARKPLGSPASLSGVPVPTASTP